MGVHGGLRRVERRDQIEAPWPPNPPYGPGQHAQQNGCSFPRTALRQPATRRLRMTNSIEKRIELKAPVSTVWRALTDHREFGEWFRVKLDGPFVPGQVSRGQITYPGYEHVKWEAV